MADRSSTAADKNRLALDLPVAENSMAGRKTGNAKNCAGPLEAHVVWQGDRLAGRQSNVLGGRSEGALPLAVPRPNALADSVIGDVIAHGFDHALRRHCAE